jgi:hypothetical protein
MLKLDWKRHELQHPGVLQWRGPVRKSYPTVRLGAHAKLKNLHSKIGRRVDLARIRYDTKFSTIVHQYLAMPLRRLLRTKVDFS